MAVIAIVYSCEKTQGVKPEIKIPASSQALISGGISFDAASPNETQSPGQTPTAVQTQMVQFTTTDSWTSSIIETKSTSWIAIYPTSGEAGDVTMTITAQPNPGTESRSVTIAILCGDQTLSFTVTQEGIPSSTVTFSTDGGNEGTTEDNWN